MNEGHYEVLFGAMMRSAVHSDKPLVLDSGVATNKLAASAGLASPKHSIT